MRLINDHQLLMNRPLVTAHLASRGTSDLDATLFFQDEHNLVLRGGRSVPPETPSGVVPSLFDPSETYLVRVTNGERFQTADIVVEYNVPNIINLRTSGLFPEEILRKIVYAPSLPYAYSNSRNRWIDVLSNFINSYEPRRATLMESLRARFPGYRNVQNVYDLPGLQALYSSAKILVNPHQTWHHHSIEEFRVLPALSQGCIIISEDVPLREYIPYHEHVLWCRYEDIPDLVSEVLADYPGFFEKIHGHPRLPELLHSMKSTFEMSLDQALARLSSPRPR